MIQIQYDLPCAHCDAPTTITIHDGAALCQDCLARLEPARRLSPEEARAQGDELLSSLDHLAAAEGWDRPTMREAVEEVRRGVIPGLRGVGCAVIEMEDGAAWSVEDHEGAPIVACYREEGRGVHRTIRHASKVLSIVRRVRWAVDQSGAIKTV